MSDPKRASLITVGDTKSAKNKVTKTVRLTINLDESNESKYPELNYKELLKAAVRKHGMENCKPSGLDPFSDNDDDVAMHARRFEQKYGGKSTYGRKGRSKREDFADIGAGYDENDSFIDNTHGYDEMVPPECDTLYGGFYINCGSLEFKPVQEDGDAISDAEQPGNRSNKRRISSSSSEESTDSSSESDSRDAKEPKAIANGAVDSHETEHRKKKNKKIDKKKPKKIRRTDSSAATSGKQTSDDNAHHGDGESADSRTSQSDSLTSKPAPSSENAITSDSSRDAEPKASPAIPAGALQALEELERASASAPAPAAAPGATADPLARHDPALLRLERALAQCGAGVRARRAAWQRAARALRTTRAALTGRVATAVNADKTAAAAATTGTTTAAASTTATSAATTNATTPPPPITAPTSAAPLVMLVPAAAAPAPAPASNSRRKPPGCGLPDVDPARMTREEREAAVADGLRWLQLLIEERRPGMIASYNAECKRVQEERKKQQIAASSSDVPHVEKRLPKRRFPWCPASSALLAWLARLAGGGEAAAALLASRALPLFPSGFVRMPTLLRQANLSKEIKAADLKKQRINPISHVSGIPIQSSFIEPIQFPSSLTVTTKSGQDKSEAIDDSKYKLNPEAVFGSIINSYSLCKDHDKTDERKKEAHDKSKEDVYIPPNIGSITITPVPSSQKTDRKVNNSSTSTDKPKESVIRVKSPAALNNSTLPLEKPKESLIRIKSPAVLNEMVKKDKEKLKKLEKINLNKEKRAISPLHIDTSYQPSKKEPSPKARPEEINPKQIEAMRLAENNIPRPALVAVHNSPTFAKPDKRPPEVKKKKDLLIVSDVDPLADNHQETVAVDDSSSDVEVIEDKDSSECANSDSRSDIVPSRDSAVSDGHVKANSVKERSLSLSKDKEYQKKPEQLDEATKELFDIVKANLSELEHSQEPTKSNSFGDSVISSGGQEGGVTVTSAERTPMSNTDGLNGALEHGSKVPPSEADSS